MSKKTPPHAQSIIMLKNFGLTENEAVIYIHLLERGTEIGGSNIAVGTGLHRQYVYLAIEKLIEQGLVEAVQHGKQHKYKAVAPSQLEKLAKRHVVETEDLVRDLNTFSAVGHEQDFEVLQGARAIQRYELAYARNVAKGTHEYIIGGCVGGFEDVMEDVLDEYIALKDAKQVGVSYLASSMAEAERYATQKYFHARICAELPAGVTHTVVRTDEVLFFSFLTPPLLYVLKSPAVAENYRQFFMMLWGK